MQVDDCCYVANLVLHYLLWIAAA